MILPGMTPIACVDGPCPRATKSAGSTRRALTLSRPTGASEPRAANRASSTTRPPAITIETAQCSRSSIDDEIGAPAGRDEAAVPEAEDARGRDGRGAIGGERRRAELDRRADHEIEMALLRDVERIAVVGAEGDERRIALGDDGASACRSLHTEPSRIRICMPLASFSFASGRLVTSWSVRMPALKIAVEGGAAQERAVSVDRPGLERRELGEA